MENYISDTVSFTPMTLHRSMGISLAANLSAGTHLHIAYSGSKVSMPGLHTSNRVEKNSSMGLIK